MNLNLIEVIEPNKGDGFRLRSKDGVVDERNQDIGELAVQIVPVSGEWEYLSTCSEDDGSLTLITEPVLAFAKNIFGRVGPVTPGCPKGVFEPYALRKVGRTTVYASDSSPFADADAWLAYQEQT